LWKTNGLKPIKEGERGTEKKREEGVPKTPETKKPWKIAFGGSNPRTKLGKGVGTGREKVE